ncbi:MAG: DUF1257 domain-containing protein [Spirochaetia bacterium]|jgi:hypothetical protein|nr:DUF1257 domain-containing protein [Spirochaetia bacterium]
MSHIAKIDTQIKNLGCLKKALESLGMGYVAPAQGKTLSLPGFRKTEVIDGCLLEIKTGCAYSIGMRRTEDGYEAAADWWAVETFTGNTREEFLERITRQYAYQTVMDKARALGFSLVSEEEDANANLRICLRRWSPA